MSEINDPADYIQRAEMHEQLAAATEDAPARKMHLAMAAEYRRKADDLRANRTSIPPTYDRTIKLDISAR